MSIGKNIKKLREQHHLSQQDLAAIAGVSDKTVSSWETDRANPRMGPIQKMADYFNIRKSDIIESVTVDFNSLRDVNKNETLLSTDEKKIIADFRGLDLFQQQTIINIIAFLKNQAANAIPEVIQNNQNGHNFFNSNGNNFTNVNN